MNILSDTTRRYHVSLLDAQRRMKEFADAAPGEREKYLASRKGKFQSWVNSYDYDLNHTLLKIAMFSFCAGVAAGISWIGTLVDEDHDPDMFTGFWGLVFENPLPYIGLVVVCVLVNMIVNKISAAHSNAMRALPEGDRNPSYDVEIYRKWTMESFVDDLRKQDMTIIDTQPRYLAVVATDGVAMLTTDPGTGELNLLLNGSPILDGYDRMLGDEERFMVASTGEKVRVKTPTFFRKKEKTGSVSPGYDSPIYARILNRVTDNM